ncbi:thiamine phosphate synthase [Heliorestis acidaminivorans]|uniref:thiamine phosphate synthase n=1 Tax=Heliorestis acidaminivorans TaxID=553427 RepID=UPI001478C84C|nr:thiamine phosphate synthase [Heliorestis acidaminivorans]
MQQKNFPKPLWIVTNRHLAGPFFLEKIAEIVQEKPSALILREKDLPPQELYELAVQVKKITEQSDTALIINSSVEVALAVQADGVHLGQGALKPAVVRSLLKTQQWLGLSVHTWEDIDNLSEQDREALDYLLLGNIFLTDCKAGKKGLGLEELSRFTSASPWPVVAIGGIDSYNGALTLRHGAKAIAIMSSAMTTQMPAKTLRDLKKSLLSFSDSY